MYYFVSDVHLGNSVFGDPRIVERRFVAWLKSIESDATALFLCGDIFDFWYEYQYVVPKGFVRVLGQLSRMTDRGVRVVFMAGNHDMWIGNYLSVECGFELYTAPRVFDIAGRKVHLAHGDNLNIGAKPMLRLMNTTFRSSVVRQLFSTLVHPDLAMRFGQWWSNSSRKGHVKSEAVGHGIEPLIRYATEHHTKHRCDYYIFGHLHTLHRTPIGEHSEAIFINDWMRGEQHCVKMTEEGDLFVEKIIE